MGRPSDYIFRALFLSLLVSQRFVVSAMKLKVTVFVERILSFVEAPWQPFARTNRPPQSPFFNCRKGLFSKMANCMTMIERFQNDTDQFLGPCTFL